MGFKIQEDTKSRIEYCIGFTVKGITLGHRPGNV